MSKYFAWLTPSFALVWMLVAAAIGLVMALFLASSFASGFTLRLLSSCLISSLLITFGSAAAGNISGIATASMSRGSGLVITNCISFAGMGLGGLLAVLLNRVLLPHDVLAVFWIMLPRLIVITLIITIAVSTAAFFYERLRLSREHLRDEITVLNENPIRQDAASRTSIALTRRGETVIVPWDDIRYVSSHGKRTVVHCAGWDYEVPGVLGRLESRLAGSPILRVHKCYLVNRSCIARLSCQQGGQYALHLCDEDESIIPVGRSYIAEVKRLIASS